MFKVTISGFENIQKNIQNLDQIIDVVLKDELYKMGQHLRSESVKECPVDTGRLRASATVTPVQKKEDKYFVEVGYGTDYAIYVHERTELHHTVGKAKYLEDPLKRNTQFYKEWFEKIIRGICG
jgi:hypothetical protein